MIFPSTCENEKLVCYTLYKHCFIYNQVVPLCCAFKQTLTQIYIFDYKAFGHDEIMSTVLISESNYHDTAMYHC